MVLLHKQNCAAQPWGGPSPESSRRVWVLTGDHLWPADTTSPGTAGETAVRREARIWLHLCSLLQMWTSVSCSVVCVVKPSVRTWKDHSSVCVLTKPRSTAPWPGSAVPGPREVSHWGSSWGLVPAQVRATHSGSEVRDYQVSWHTAVSGSFHALSEPALSVN